MPESLEIQFRKEKKLFRALREYFSDDKVLNRKFGLLKNMIRLIAKFSK